MAGSSVLDPYLYLLTAAGAGMYSEFAKLSGSNRLLTRAVLSDCARRMVT